MTPNLTLHLLQTDCRRSSAWLVIYALFCLLQAITGMLGPTDTAGEISSSLLVFGQVVLGTLLIINTIHGDAPVSPTAAWKTRPVSRPQLFAAKLIFIGGIVQGGFVLAQIPAWWMNGFDPVLLAGSTLQWLLITGAIIWSVSAVAAWSNDFKTLMGKAGAVVFGLLAFAIICDRMGLTGGRTPYSPTRTTSTTALTFLLVTMGGFGSWTLATLRGRIPQAIALYVTVSIAVLALLWTRPFDLLAHKPVPWQAGEIELITDTEISANIPSGEQLLWSHFRVTGLPSNAIALPFRLTGVFRETGTKRQVELNSAIQAHGGAGISKYFNSGMDGFLLDRLTAFYPPDTLWFDNLTLPVQRSLPTLESSGSSGDWLTTRPVGQLNTTLGVELINLRRIVDIPLRSGAHQSSEGVQISVVSETERETGREFRIRESMPSLWFSDHPEHLGSGAYRSHCLYVIHDPESGAAWPIDIRASHRRPVNPLSNTTTTETRHTLTRSTLRDRLSGTTSTKKPALRLHAYYPESAGKRTVRFKDKQYVWATTRIDERGKKQNEVDTTDLATLHWPGAENAATADQFFDDFLALLPRNPRSPLREQASAKLLEIGIDGLPLLLERLPVRNNVRFSIVDPVLLKLANRSHLPALQKTLARYPGFATFFRSMHWEGDAAGILLDMLPGRERPLPRWALVIAAKFARPEHYQDLRWHIVNTDGASEDTLAPLAELPDFPFADVVRERWRLHLINQDQDSGLAAYAARLGELAALRELVGTLEIGIDAKREAFLLGIVRDAIEFQGDLPGLKTWLSTHLESLRYDPVLSRFRIFEG